MVMNRTNPKFDKVFKDAEVIKRYYVTYRDVFFKYNWEAISS